MGYVALYRQWRPQDFEHLVGQEHIRKTLMHALVAGKVAHAYLFAGPRGTGKTSTAKIFAKSLNCETGPTPTPCNTCSNCQKITNGSSMDVFEIDAASNRGIDEIRDLRETVKFAPVDGRYKVYIIDEVHMLTTEAFNALLKTLEEPPAHVVFILATTEAHKIPATIHSRCQRYDFRRITPEEICERLTEVAAHHQLSIAPEALGLIAAHADGGLRDALSILDQCSTLSEGTISVENVRSLLGLIGHEAIWRLTTAIAERDVRTALTALNELLALGKDIRQLLLELAQYLRSLLLHLAAPDMSGLTLYGDDKNMLTQHSAAFSQPELTALIQTLHEASNEVKWSPEPRIVAEVVLLKACRRQVGDGALAALEARLAALEAQVAAGGNVGWSAPVPAPLSAAPSHAVEPLAAQPRPAPATIVRQPSAATSSRPATAPSVEKAPAPSAAEQAITPVVAAGGEAALVPNGELAPLWDAVLKDLVANGKRSVHACVSQGQLVAMDDKQATVQFTAAFPKERTEKADYRAMVEKVLTQISGKSVQLCCILGSATPPAAKPAPQAPAKPAQVVPPEPAAEMPPHPALEQAIKFFGGKVIANTENKEE